MATNSYGDTPYPPSSGHYDPESPASYTNPTCPSPPEEPMEPPPPYTDFGMTPAPEYPNNKQTSAYPYAPPYPNYAPASGYPYALPPEYPHAHAYGTPYAPGPLLSYPPQIPPPIAGSAYPITVQPGVRVIDSATVNDIPDYMCLSIVSIFCCIFIGILSTIQATSALGLKSQGKFELAQAKARSARNLAIAAIVLGLLATSLAVALPLALFSTGMDDY